MSLTGDETLQVQGQDPSGHPAGETFTTTTGEIAALSLTTFTLALTTPNGVVNTGTNIDSFTLRGNFVITQVYAEVRQAPTTTAIIININITGNGSILSTLLHIDPNTVDSTSSSTQAVISTAGISANQSLNIDVVQTDSSFSSAGGKVTIAGYYVD